MTLAAMVAASGAAVAADLPRGPTPYYAPAPSYYNWSGLYTGLNLGYEWGHVTGSSIDPSGIAGGGQVGYNWQWNQFVLGAETDIQASAADDTFAPWKFSNPWFGTLRGRAGCALNNILFYGTAGLAYGELSGELNCSTRTRRWSAGPPASVWRSASTRIGRPRSSISTWTSASAPTPSPGVDAAPHALRKTPGLGPGFSFAASAALVPSYILVASIQLLPEQI